MRLQKKSDYSFGKMYMRRSKGQRMGIIYASC